MENYSDLTVEVKNNIAKSLGSNIKEHLVKLKEYSYFTTSTEFIVLDGDKIITKSIKTGSFIQSIPGYKNLKPNVTKDDIELWGEASFIVNNSRMSIMNDGSEKPLIFPMKYSPDDSIVRSYNKKIISKYVQKNELTLGKQGSKMIDKMLPGIAGVNKNDVYNKVNHILKDVTDPSDINSIMRAVNSSNKVSGPKRRFIK